MRSDTLTDIKDCISSIPQREFRVPAMSGDVTELLQELKQGNKAAEARLIPLVYKELRRIAAAHLRRESPQHSLQPTALVHEAYLRLTGITEIDWQSRSHFFAVSATIMRRILVDHARAQQTRKRGDGWDSVSLNDAILPSPERAPEILALGEGVLRLVHAGLIPAPCDGHGGVGRKRRKQDRASAGNQCQDDYQREAGQRG